MNNKPVEKKIISCSTDFKKGMRFLMSTGDEKFWLHYPNKSSSDQADTTVALYLTESVSPLFLQEGRLPDRTKLLITSKMYEI